MRNLNFSAFANRLALLVLATFPVLANAQIPFTTQGGEFAAVGALPGDQVHSQISFDANGGWVVWQDNVTDGNGLGIGGRHLNSTLSGDLNVFRVNAVAAGDQENPHVTMLKDGGAAFVWQGGRPGSQRIFARFMNPDETFVGADIQVNTYTNQQQINPVIACLNNSNVVVAWVSDKQDGSMAGVFGRVLSPAGTPVSGEFRVNQTTNLNQRAPAVSALANGNFVVVWTSDHPRTITNTNDYSINTFIDVYGRLFNPTGGSVGGEFLISSGGDYCSSPSVAGTSDGGFTVAWGQNDLSNSSNSWDAYVRCFDATASPKGSPTRVNTQLFGDQFAPVIAASGTNAFVVWTSLGQDGSYEGVYGQYVNLDGTPVGSELQINTTTVNKQLQPSLAVDDTGRYLVLWSSFVGVASGFDLYAQRYTAGDSLLPVPSAPYVSALDQSRLSVAWPALAGYAVAFYEITLDGATNPIVVSGIRTTITNLVPSSTHSVQLSYQLNDGRRSQLSLAATGKTWGVDANNDGLPDDWQAAYWGNNPANWPSANSDSDGDGVSNLMEFLAGTDPTDPASVLRSTLTRSGQAMTFSWNTQAGFVYQVQTSTNLASWSDYGSPRFAHGAIDSVPMTGSNQSVFYRVVRLR